MHSSSRHRLVSRLLVASLALACAPALLAAQTPPAASPAAPAAAPSAAPQHWSFPAPTNLQVLPKNLTGQQVHEIMEQWEGQLGSGCRTCHAVDKTKVGPNGRPRLNFADDSKEEKRIARMMYTMTGKINADYISMVPNSGQPVTCGTCHRGHLGPEEYIPQRHEEHPAAPAAAPGAPAAPATHGQ